MRLYRAQPLDPRLGDQINDIVAALANRAGLTSAPRVYVIPSMTLNAFAAGTPTHAVIGITEGLLRRLTMREIAGVLAHEISHIRNNDLWVMGLADLMTRFAQALSYVAVFLAMLNILGSLNGERYASWTAVALLYFAPAISSLMQLGLARTREYEADLEGALLTGDPLGLASALRRLERYTGRFWEDLMLPIPARRVPQPSLLRTHPSTEDRVARLLSLSRSTAAAPAIVTHERPMISLVGVGPIEMRPRYRWPGVWF
jgi:heat shock protein HtpX